MCQQKNMKFWCVSCATRGSSITHLSSPSLHPSGFTWGLVDPTATAQLPTVWTAELRFFTVISGRCERRTGSELRNVSHFLGYFWKNWGLSWRELGGIYEGHSILYILNDPSFDWKIKIIFWLGNWKGTSFRGVKQPTTKRTNELQGTYLSD